MISWMQVWRELMASEMLVDLLRDSRNKSSDDKRGLATDWRVELEL